MNKTVKKLKAIEKRLSKDLDARFGLKKIHFFGDMRDGHLTLVITGKER